MIEETIDNAGFTNLHNITFNDTFLLKKTFLLYGLVFVCDVSWKTLLFTDSEIRLVYIDNSLCRFCKETNESCCHVYSECIISNGLTSTRF